MKKQLLVGLVSVAVAANAIADIQDPPSNDYGPTRKLGRGIANFYYAGTEVPVTIGRINKEEGNSAAASYGVMRGLGRSTARHFVGLFEIFTFPAPIWRDGYRPILPSDVPWIHAGYAEFPPELGFESKYPYCREY